MSQTSISFKAKFYNGIWDRIDETSVEIIRTRDGFYDLYSSDFDIIFEGMDKRTAIEYLRALIKVLSQVVRFLETKEG